MKPAYLLSGLIGAGLVVSAGFAAKTGEDVPAPPADPIALIPAEAGLVVGARLTDARGAALWSSIKGGVDDAIDAKLPDLAKDCGFDPIEQLDDVVAGFAPGQFAAGQAEGHHDFVAVARLRFDNSKLFACARSQAEKEGMQIHEVKLRGHAVYALGGVEVSCIDARTCIVGTKAWVGKALDLADHLPEARDVMHNAAMAALLTDTNRQDDLWWAGTVLQEVRDQLAAGAPGGGVPELKDTHGSAALGHGLDAKIRVGVASPAAAKQMAAAATSGVAGLVGKPQLHGTELASYLGKLTFGTAGAQFTVDVKLSPEETDGLTRMLTDLQANAAALTKERATAAIRPR